MSKIKKLYWEQGPDDEDSETMGATHVLGTWSPTTTWPGAKKGSGRLLFPDCRHWRQRFELQGGLHVFASAWLDKPREPGGRPRPSFKGQPDIGFYLDSRWASESLLVSPGFNPPFVKGIKFPRLVLYPWEDWGVPEDLRMFRRALRWILTEARREKRVEIACMAGHGRTGTALACLLVIQGLSPSRAISRVKSRYCEEAIESRKQLDFIRLFGR